MFHSITLRLYLNHHVCIVFSRIFPEFIHFFEADSILNTRGEKVELMDNFRSIQGNQDVSQQAVGLLLATMHSILQHL